MVNNNSNVIRRIDDIYKQLSINDKPINQKYIADPVLWATECFGMELYPWQRDALRSSAKRSLWNIHRQGAKSTTAALKALYKVVFKTNSLTLMISRSERQSGELYRKFLGYYDRLDNPPGMPEDKALSCTLENGSRVVALPGLEDTVRCFSAVDLIIEDESSRVHDAVFDAITPMVAVSGGDILLLSTPFGTRGHFHSIATDPDNGWEKITVTADKCPNITKEFLDSERRRMPISVFNAEYMCQFTDSVDSVFTYDQVASAFSSDVEPLIIEVEEW